MAKRKQSRKQREASLKNLRKARRARKIKGEVKPRKARGRKRRMSAAQRAAALKNLEKGRHKRRKSRKAAPKAEPSKRRRKSGSKKSRRSSGRRGATHRSSSRTVKQTIIKHIPAGGVVVTTPKRRKARKGKGHKHTTKHKGGHKRSHKGGHRRHKGAMENPMTGTELFVGSVTGLAGFLTADALDRFLATHALTGTAAPYTDTPPTSGDYQGLMNATAICAPMNAVRWAAGLGLAAAPIIIANFVTAPTGRAALQFFGFAAGLRIVGKGLIDITASLLQSNQIGQQLYDGEMRASLLQQSKGASSTALTALPSSGLGRPAPRRMGAAAPCAPCAAASGAGYPSMPVNPATAPAAPTQNVAPPPPAPAPAPTPATPAPTAPSAQTSGLTGAPRLPAAPVRPAPTSRRGQSPNRFNWGSAE